MNELTHIDLFSGIGGFALAARWAGIKTVQFVEIDKFCHKVLNKNFPGVPIHDDIKTFKWTGTNPFILTGGFPCQPFSCAGKQRGTDDNRYLWPEMLRVISEAKPKWIIGENVKGFISNNNGMVFENCCLDLEREGYAVQAFIIPACAVNAPHRRDRIWILAHSTSERNRGCASNKCGVHQRIMEQNKQGRSAVGSKSEGCFSEPTNNYAPDSNSERLQRESVNLRSEGKKSNDEQSMRCGGEWQENWLEVATRLCRVDDGLPRQVDRVNRLKALGNSIVPQVAYEIMKSILNVENES